MLAPWNRLKLFFTINSVAAGVFGLITLGFSSVFSTELSSFPLLYKLSTSALLVGFGSFVFAGIFYSIWVPDAIIKYDSEDAIVQGKNALFPERSNFEMNERKKLIRDDCSEWKVDNESRVLARLIIVSLLSLSGFCVFSVLLIFVST